jgi:hypothetical protein
MSDLRERIAKALFNRRVPGLTFEHAGRLESYYRDADAVLAELGWKPGNSDEVELLLALSALYRVNSAPGRHVITFPADPNGKWEYEWVAAGSPEEKTP